MALDPFRPQPRDADLRRVYAAFGASLGLLFPFLALVLAQRGFSAAIVGLLIGGYYIAVAVAAPLWSSVADRHHGSAGTLQMLLIAAAGAALLLSQTGANVAATLLAMMVFGAVMGPTTPLLDTMALRYLGPSRATAYGTFRLFGSLGWTLSVLVFGLALEWTGVGVVLPAFSLGVLGYRAFTARFRGQEQISVPNGVSRFGSAADALRKNPSFALFLGGALLVGVGVFSAWTFVPLRISGAGGGPFLAGLGVGVAALFEVPLMLRSAQLDRRFGVRGCYAIGVCVYIAQMILWMVVKDPLMVTIVMMARGLGFGLAYVATVRIADSMVPAHAQNAGQLMVSMVGAGLAPTMGAAVGGLMYDSFGPSALFGFSATATAMGAVLVWRSLSAAHTTRVPAMVPALDDGS